MAMDATAESDPKPRTIEPAQPPATNRLGARPDKSRQCSDFRPIGR